MSQSIRASVAWSAVRNWGVRLGSVVLFFVLARILPLSQLGLFSAAASIIAFAELFAENGLGDAVVQAPELDDRMLSGALVLNVMLGATCVFALILTSPWLEQAFAAQGLAPVLSIAVLAMLMNAFSYIPQSLLRRKLQFKWLAVRGLVATFVSGAVGIGLAVAGYGVTALIVQFVLAAFFNLVFVWLVRPFRFRLTSPTAAFPLVRFGSRVFGTKLLDYLANRSIELAILASLGAASLALFILASRLWAVLMQLISAVTVDVSLPVFARLAGDREALLAAFYGAVRLTLALGVPVFILLSALAPEVMPTVFGDNGRGGAPILTWLAILGAFQIVQFYNGTMLTAVGRPDVSLKILVFRAVVVAIVLALLFGRPVTEVAVGYALAQIAITPVSFWIGRRIIDYSLVRLSLLAAPFVAGCAVMFIAIVLARPFVEPVVPSPLFRGIALGGIGGLCYLAVVMVAGRKSFLAALSSVTGRKRQGAPI